MSPISNDKWGCGAEGSSTPQADGGAGRIGEQPCGAIAVVVPHSELLKRDQMKRCFSPRHGFELIEENQGPEAVLLRCRSIAPCVLVVDDLFLGRVGAAEFARSVAYGYSVRVLVVGRDEEDQSILRRILALGCMGYMHWGQPPSKLRRAVRALARGEIWANRATLSELLRGLLVANDCRSLAPREKEILRLIGLGYENRAIADQLGITRETVRWYIRSLHAKLGVRDRLETALIARSLSNGLSAITSAGSAA